MWNWLGGVAHGVAGARCALLTAADDMGPDIGQGRAATHHCTTAQAAAHKNYRARGQGSGRAVYSAHPPVSSRCLCTKPGTRGGHIAGFLPRVLHITIHKHHTAYISSITVLHIIAQLMQLHC